MQTYIINLSDSVQRLRDISSDMRHFNMSFERIEAVDGRGKNPKIYHQYNEKRSLSRHNKSLSGGEIACYLSHIKSLEEFILSSHDIALILEDDAKLQPSFRTDIDFLQTALRNDSTWDVVNLVEPRDSWCKVFQKFGDNELRRAYYFPMLTTANLWSKKGAKAFLESRFGREIAGPIDTELRSFCAARGRGLSVRNPLIRPTGVASDIDAIPSSTRKSGRRTLQSRLTRHLPDHICAAYHYLKG